VTTRDKDATATRDRVALDGLSFLLADVQDNLGAFLTGILTTYQWVSADIGVAIASGGAGAVLTRIVGGLALDRLSAHRALLAACCVITVLSIIAIAWWPQFWIIVFAHFCAASAGAMLSPLLAAISQNVTAPRFYVARMGRNESFNHLGNAGIGCIVAAAGTAAGALTGLWAIATLALVGLALVLVLTPRADMPTERQDGRPQQADGAWQTLSDPRLLIFLTCYLLFNLSNAGVVPLLIERQALFNFSSPGPTTSLCIVVAQAVMVPVAFFVGRYAEGLRRKPLLLLALAGLPIRTLLLMYGAHWGMLFAAEILDGFTSGVFLVLFYAVLSDITGATPHRNFVIGFGLALGTVGALLSNSIGGWIASGYGFNAAFAALAALGTIGVVQCLLFMPETLCRHHGGVHEAV